MYWYSVKLVALNPDYGDFGFTSAGTSSNADEYTRSERRNLDGYYTGTSQSGAGTDVDDSVDTDGVDVSDDTNANLLYFIYESERIIYSQDQLQQSKIGDASTSGRNNDVDVATA